MQHSASNSKLHQNRCFSDERDWLLEKVFWRLEPLRDIETNLRRHSKQAALLRVNRKIMEKSLSYYNRANQFTK